MELLAITTDVWALLWTTLATLILLLVPGVVYAYYVLDGWVDGDSYSSVMTMVDRRGSKPGN